MRLVKFPYEVRGGDYGNQIKYPDDQFDAEGMLTLDGSGLYRCYVVGEELVGEYDGELPLEEYIPPAEYKTFLSGSELIKLTGLPYGVIENAASSGDNVASYFVAIGREINAEGNKVWVEHPDYVTAVAHFLSQGYIDQTKHDEMLQGVEV